ncbi:MAG: DUF2514 family protein [Xylophilus ampelinus]
MLLAGALAGAGYRAGVGREHDRRLAEVAEIRRSHAEILGRIAGLTQRAEQAARAEETRRATAIEEIAHAAQTDIDAARAGAADAERAADGLRQQVRAYADAARRRAADPGPATAGAPAADAFGVLADVLERADRRAGDLAAIADDARARGHACERIWSALTEAEISRRLTRPPRQPPASDAAVASQ